MCRSLAQGNAVGAALAGEPQRLAPGRMEATCCLSHCKSGCVALLRRHQQRMSSAWARWQVSLLGRLRLGGPGGGSLGASGAVYACFAASAVLHPDRKAAFIFLPNVSPACCSLDGCAHVGPCAEALPGAAVGSQVGLQLAAWMRGQLALPPVLQPWLCCVWKTSLAAWVLHLCASRRCRSP